MDAPAMTKRRKVVFIAGTGHSGSTLLDMCLGGHPDVTSLGETGFLYLYAKKLVPQHICTCGQTVDMCPFWLKTTTALAEMRGTTPEQALDGFILSDPEQIQFDDKGHYVERLPHQPRINHSLLRSLLCVLGSRTLFSFAARLSPVVNTRLKAASNRLKLFDAVFKAHAPQVIVDSSKSPGTIKEAWMLRKNIDADILFIVMVRDGRAVAASDMRRLGLTLGQAARRWRGEFLKWLLARLTIPSTRILSVHYEDLAQKPETELTRICNFIGIPYAPDLLAFRGERHNVGGNQMRFRHHENTIRLDEKWRRELGTDDITAFNRIAGWLNRALGYEA